MNVEWDLEKIKNDAFFDNDFMWKCLQEMDPFDFEELILVLLKNIGYDTVSTSKTGDMGVDGYAYKDGFKIVVQAKRYKSTVPFQYVTQFYGVLTHEKADQGIFATTSSISNQGLIFLKDKPIVVWDKRKIVELIQKFLEPHEFPGGLPVYNYRKFNKGLVQEGAECPRCNAGKIVVRKRRVDGRPFYGCTKWPSCNFLQNIELPDDGEKIKVVDNTSESSISLKNNKINSDAYIDEHKKPIEQSDGFEFRWYHLIILFVIIKAIIFALKMR